MLGLVELPGGARFAQIQLDPAKGVTDVGGGQRQGQRLVVGTHRVHRFELHDRRCGTDPGDLVVPKPAHGVCAGGCDVAGLIGGQAIEITTC